MENSCPHPTLTICVLTMNEKDNIEKTLESIKGIGNETIVMDENSVDGTRDILNKYNVKIIDCKLNDDFSNIRNTAIIYSISQWILFIDADETLDIPLRDVLYNRELLKYCDIHKFDVVTFKRRNYENDIESMRFYPDYQQRLCRNNGKIKYVGRVHEILIGYTKNYFSNYHLIHRRTNYSPEDELKKHEKYKRIKLQSDKEKYKEKYLPIDYLSLSNY